MGKDPGSIPMGDPLALFLTWTAYGSWLTGDARGRVEKPGRFGQLDAKREQARAGPVEGVVLVEIVNRDVALSEVSNRVDNHAVRPNNKDRSMGWFGTKPVMKLTNRDR